MEALQLFSTILFLFIYAIAISKHGQSRLNKDGEAPTKSSFLVTILLIHGLYFWGDFYTTFGLPQIILIFWDVVIAGFYVSKREDSKNPGEYNAYRSIGDAILTFSCLYAGGFYTKGVPVDKLPW